MQLELCKEDYRRLWEKIAETEGAPQRNAEVEDEQGRANFVWHGCTFTFAVSSS
jgi:hypothetical protein